MYDINAIEVKRWRELILKRQETDADKKLFLEGEKISKIIEESDDENVLKIKIASILNILAIFIFKIILYK